MSDETNDVLVVAKKIVTAGVGIILLFVVLSSWVTIQQGEVGVVFNKYHGGVAQKTLGQGWHFRIPIVQRITAYPVSMRTYSTIGEGEGSHPGRPELVTLPTMGGQHIDQQMSMTYHVAPEKASLVFDKFKGADIEIIEIDFIRRNVQSVATAVVGKYDLMDVLGPKKQEIQDKIFAGVKMQLEPYGFVVDQINLGYAKPPEAIETALQAKMQAEQQADQAKYTLQKNEMEARAKIAAAEGEAKSNALVRQQLSPEFLQFRALEVRQKAIEKWNGVLPTQMIPGSTVPFINLNTEK
jgi:prohibitin 2